MSGRYQKYSKYKATGSQWIAEIPEHWDIKSLKSVLIERKENNRPVKTTQILSLTMEKGVVLYSERGGGGNKHKDDLTAYKLAYPNDIVLNSMNVVVGSVGLSKYFGAVSPVYYMLRPRYEEDSVEYFSHIFQCKTFQQSLLGLGNGIMMKQAEASGKLNTIRMRIPMGKLNTQLLPLPPPEEQTQIAKFLDYETAKIDALIAKQQQLIALLQEKRQAVISHAVTKGLNPAAPLRDSGVAWLGQVPAHWEVAPLKHHIHQFDQGWSPQCEQRRAGKGEWGVMKVGCVNGGVFNRNENKCLPETLIPRIEYVLRRGDLLISRANTRELVGSAAVVLEDEPNLQLCDKLYRLRLGSVPEAQFISHYLEASLTRQQLELEATGASHSMQNITQDTIRNLPVPIPPLQEVNEIVAELKRKLMAIDSIMSKGNAQIEILQERRTALIAAAVTGKIDVRGWQPPPAAPTGAMA